MRARGQAGLLVRNPLEEAGLEDLLALEDLLEQSLRHLSLLLSQREPLLEERHRLREDVNLADHLPERARQLGWCVGRVGDASAELDGRIAHGARLPVRWADGGQPRRSRWGGRQLARQQPGGALLPRWRRREPGGGR